MTGISWTDETWNPVRGCSRVSEGCRHCYAEVQAARIVRMSRGKPSPYDGLVKLHPDGYAAARWTGKVAFDTEALAKPLRWRKPRRIFVNSMSDLFHESLTNEQIAAVFGVMAACPQHTFQVLTKRARRMREWFEWLDGEAGRERDAAVARGEDHRDMHVRVLVAYLDRGYHIDRAHIAYPRWPIPNVHLGVSVEDQAAADERIPDLLATPAAVRWLSMEPLLGPVRTTLRRSTEQAVTPWGFPIEARTQSGIDWVVAGCESGHDARPCDVAWLRSIRDQCAAARVPFWLKQAVGSHAVDAMIYGDPITAGPGSRRKPGGVIELPYLDGKQHITFPEVAR